MKKSILFTFFVCVILIGFIPLPALLADYTFNQSVGTYTEITGGTVFGTETSDDQRFVDPATPAGGTINTGVGIPIGFNFAFNDNTFDVIAISNNGWISFGQSALGTSAVNINSSSSYTPLSSTVAITPSQLYNRIAGFARDIQAQTGASLRVETVGSAPNRICVVQFHNYKRYGTNGTGDIINFQIRLYETLNKVQIAYGPCTFGGTAATPYPQVGMRGPDVTDFVNRTTTTSWLSTTAGTLNTDTCAFTADCVPVNGLVFEYLPPVPLANDLHALSITGTATPSVGTAANYTVTVRNRGLNPQTAYSVKLMSGTTELASVAGPALAPQDMASVIISWTPAAEGPMQIYGKVVLANDENPANDQTTPISITVMPAGTLIINIGDGSQTNYYSPISPYYLNSLYENIYFESEMTAVGTIMAVSFYNNFSSATFIDKPIKIWLGLTSQTDLSSGWVPSSSLTLVYDGTLTCPPGQNTIPISLQNPYPYTGGNLVMMVQRVMDTQQFTTTDLFYNQTIGTNRARRVYSNTVQYDPAAPAAGTLTGQFPKTTFTLSSNLPANDLTAYELVGNMTPSVGAASNYSFKIRNLSSAPQNNYTAKLMSGTTELASVAGPPIAINGLVTVTIPWIPTTEGQMQIYGKVVLTGDSNPNNDQTQPLTVNVMPAGTIVVTVGDGSQDARLPVDMFYRNSLFETIYQSDEMTAAGVMTAITFYNNFTTTTLMNMPTRIWLGLTEQSDLSAGWIPANTLTQVFDGTVDYPGGLNNIFIPLQMPFIFPGGNLVMMVQRPYEANYHSSADYFKCQTVGSNRTRMSIDDTTVFDPNNPSTTDVTVSGQFPKTTFNFLPLANTPQFAVSPENYNFGLKLLNTTTDQTFTIMNAGGGTTPLIINSITISGSPFFTLQNMPTLPVSLASAQSASFQVRYHPTAAGTHSAVITITDNLARQQHTVQVTGNCIDPTIYTSPYVQNFDSVTTPNLPIDWSIYTVSPGTVTTSTTSPHSSPNCVYIYNSTSTNGPYLISPPVSPNIPLVTTRTKFWAKGATTYHLSVGAMVNPADPATFTQIADLTLTSSWAEYIVSFQTYSGSGQYIAFKHGNAATVQSIYVDDIMIEVTPDNDLGALSLTGNFTPTVGVASTYTIAVKNWGVNTQSNYSVKLYNAANQELASAPGPTVLPDATVNAEINWTPATSGTMVIYGKVVLTGDQNSLNDKTPNVNVWVQPAGTLAITIGTGSETNYYSPIAPYYKNSLFENIYFEDEINGGGLLNALGFYYNFTDTTFVNKPVRVWLGITDLTNLSAGWVNSTNLTLVFDGTISCSAGQNILAIPLQNPFVYTGGNLIMLVQRVMDTVYIPSTNVFYNQTVGTNRARRLYSDTVAYDPANPSATGTLTGQFPKTTLFFNVGGLGSIHGTVTSGGNPLAGATVAIAGSTSHATTGADGTYTLPYLVPNTYQVTCSKIAYISQTLTATVVADQQTTLNFNLQAQPTVNVTGTVYGSDAPTVGLAGADVVLHGILDYSGTTNAQGHFTIPNVLTNNTYTYTISKSSYQNATGSITIGMSDYNLGSVILTELTLPPSNLQAVENAAQTQVTLTWRVPSSGGGSSNLNDFEANDGGWVPSSNWSNPLGDWQWTNTYNVSNYVTGEYPASEVPPPAAHSGTGLWGTILYAPYTNSGGFSYLTKSFNFSAMTNPTLDFWSWQNLFGNFDYAQVSVNGTVVWGPTTVSNPVWQNVVVDLTAYAGQADVVIRFEEFATTVVAYAGWYIDDVYVGPAQRTEKSAPAVSNLRSVAVPEMRESNRNRAIVGYKVWRLLQGQETDETNWTLLTANAITDTSYVDMAWASLPNGNYKWAVKTVYTNNVMSAPAISNMIRILPYDLSALSISGPTTPTAGTPFNYTVVIKNTGTTPQLAGSYTVKLMSGTTELASVNGPAIAVNEQLSVTIPWTPAEAGTMSIFGKVVHPQDAVPTNDATAVLTVNVQPAGTFLISIGEGTSNQRQPFGIYFGYERDASLIDSTLIGLPGVFTSFQWYCATTSTALVPYRIYIKPTTMTAMTATTWSNMVDGATLLCEGLLAFTQVGWTAIPLQNPYIYLGGNFLVLVETFYGGSGTSSYPKFNYTAGPTGCHQYWATDSTPPSGNGTVNTSRPNIGIFFIPVGVGNLTGTVYGVGNQPLAGATVQIIGGAQAITDAQGHYTINTIVHGTYNVSCSAHGYISQTVSVTIVEDQTTTQNFTLQPMPTVTVSGTIVGSDAPTVGLQGATFTLTGYENYTATANAAGVFTLPAVYANQTYNYSAVAIGYQMLTGTLNVASANVNMGTLTLSEIAYTPRNVNAIANAANTQVTLTWLAPDPNALDITQGFESEPFPPTNWTRIVTNNGPANTLGVYPTWCRIGTIVNGQEIIAPAEGSWQAGYWWAYSHQDEWLITPQFNCPQGAHLTFSTYCCYGSPNNDHYYVKVSSNNGANWNVLWDASAQPAGWNYYTTPVQIDLSAYAGQQIKIAWHADDPNTTNDGMWNSWFIDNIVIANGRETVRFAESDLTVKSGSGKESAPLTVTGNLPVSKGMLRKGNNDLRSVNLRAVNPEAQVRNRSLVGYKVWRLMQGQEQIEANWTLLTPDVITDETLLDDGWAAVAPGTYKWAIKAVYTNNVYSLAAFSNALVKPQIVTGNLSGFVRNVNNMPISGAVITAGSYTTTSSVTGNYLMSVAVGTYTVTCSAAGYQTMTHENIVVLEGQTTTCNFMLPVGNNDVVEVRQTILLGNNPNPFTSSTTITYEVKEPLPVEIEIYNLKGQLVRTLVSETKSRGRYSAVWDGCDRFGQPVAGGIYHYRMKAGSYHSERLMLLLK